MAEKILAELRNRNTVPPSREQNPNERENAGVEVPLSADCMPEQRSRRPEHQTDGEERLSGGREGEIPTSSLGQGDTPDGSTLPPPYSSHCYSRGA